MQTQVQQLLVKLEYLSANRLAEVEDFIDFLQHKDRTNSLTSNFSQASNASFNKIWSNDDDAIYDDL